MCLMKVILMNILIGSPRFGLAALLLTAGVINSSVSSLASATPTYSSTTTYYLRYANKTALGTPGSFGGAPSNFGKVKVSLYKLDKDMADIVFSSNTADGYYFTDGGAVAVNGNGLTTSVTNLTGLRDSTTLTSIPKPTPTLSYVGSYREGVFGSFNTAISIPKGSFKKRLSTISFTLNDSNTSWTSATEVLTPNGTNGLYSVGAHIGHCVYTQGKCSSFSITGRAANGSSYKTVAEPSTLGVLGAGLLGLAWLSGAFRRRHESHS